MKKDNNNYITLRAETGQLNLNANCLIVFNVIYSFEKGFYGGYSFFEPFNPFGERTYYRIVDKLVELDLISEKKLSKGTRILTVKPDVIKRLKKVDQEIPKKEKVTDQSNDDDDPYNMDRI